MKNVPSDQPIQSKPPYKIGGLGEIAIRCRDKAAMVAFYADVIGLELLAHRGDRITFFKVCDGIAGHITVLALFAEGEQARAGENSSLHHLALSLPYAEQEKAIAWFEQRNITYKIEYFDWVGWRGVFTQDPEGNTVELVAHVPLEKDSAL